MFMEREALSGFKTKWFILLSNWIGQLQRPTVPESFQKPEMGPGFVPKVRYEPYVAIDYSIESHSSLWWDIWFLFVCTCACRVLKLTNITRPTWICLWSSTTLSGCGGTAESHNILFTEPQPMTTAKARPTSTLLRSFYSQFYDSLSTLCLSVHIHPSVSKRIKYLIYQLQVV